MCGPPLDGFILPSYFSSRQSTKQNISNFICLCTRYSRLSLTVSILSLPSFLVNFFRLSNSLHPLFFVVFTHFSDYLLSFSCILSFQGHREWFRNPVKEHLRDTPERADRLKIKKICNIFGPRAPFRIVGPR